MVSSTHIARLRYEWWVTFLVTLSLLVLETIEHWPNLFALDLVFVAEVLGLLTLPLVGGLGLSWLKRHGSEPVLFSRKASAVSRQRILVIEDNLLSELVSRLLNQAADLDVVGLAPRDEAALVEEIRRIRPAVVVLDAATKLTDPDDLLCLLDDEPNSRVIAVSADDNTVRVYDKRRVLITRGGDLVAIVRNWLQA